MMTVSAVNQYIKALLSSDINLSGLWVQGEISNFKLHTSGHAYFSLKDSGGVLRCVMFRSRAAGLAFRPRDGMKVLVYGNITVYERDGAYQLYAERMEPDGVGALYLAFEELKKRLAAEGLFDPGRKKPIPFLPDCVGVITSETGAVIQDIKNVLFRRFPTMHLKIFPSAVQGETAAEQIAAALTYVSRTKCCDVVILARGGGSIEDLWPFNEELTARAIAACRVPVISAVGHETDYTIADFTADFRAPTPSAAAELVVPELNVLRASLDTYTGKMRLVPRNNIQLKRMELERAAAHPVFRRPFECIQVRRQLLSDFQERMAECLVRAAERQRQRIQALQGRLQALNPMAVLERGYGIVQTADGKMITDPAEASAGDALSILLQKGILKAVVSEEQEKGGKL